ncbi:MAG: DUF1801 domain-containing protein [Bermanella sp.]
MKMASYLKEIPLHRTERFDAILGLIKEMYPSAMESMKYQMPTFENIEDNQSGVKPGWIALANKKSYLSLYTCMEAHITPFKVLHPQIKTGVGCINFRDKDDIFLADLKVVIKSAMEYQHK